MALTLERVELRRIELPLVSPFRTSTGTWTSRDVLLVRATVDGVDGWGECVAPRAPTYGPEYTAGAEAVIVEHLLPLLLAAGRAGQLESAAGVEVALAEIHGHRMAKAALEAAVLDAELRASGVSLAAHLGATRTRVPVGVAVGIQRDLDELVTVVARHVAEGYGRVKIKIEPGWDTAPCRALREAFGDEVAVQVDANGAYAPSDTDHLRALDAFGLLCIEQPFADDALVDHAALARSIATPVCLDESITSEQACADAIELGAADVIAVKPGRVGGHLAARRIHDRCVATGTPLWMGGMLETGIGRAANLALAALDGFTLPGDISAASRYWHHDIVTEPARLDPDGTIAVPSGPGIGVEVDLDVLSSVTTRITIHELQENP